MKLFEYADRQGRGACSAWVLDASVVSRLIPKMDMLARIGYENAKNLLPSVRRSGWILRLRVKPGTSGSGRSSAGPFVEDEELTFLMPARESSGSGC
ncbi:MAG TPA: hypothetical protein VMS76_19920 [Planctomycetota bacterium]|nr:hypothetical protein [Planctomycetota bacterium]